MSTSNKEWQQMSQGEKIWYLVLSLFYGFILSIPTAIACVVILVKKTDIFDPRPLVGIFVVVPFMVIVFLIQMARIQLSFARMEDKHESKKRINFWDWETNLQFYGMSWMVLSTLGWVGIGYVLLS